MARYVKDSVLKVTLTRNAEIGEIIKDAVSENEVYYFEVIEKLPEDWYRIKLIGVNGYLKLVI